MIRSGTGPRSGDADHPTVLVTGAAGFIGSHLCDSLLEESHRVWGLDNFSSHYAPSRKRHNLRSALDHDAMHLVEGDIRDPVLLDGLMADQEFDAVVHLAACPGNGRSVERPAPTFDVNVSGTLTLLEAMRRHRVPCLIFASSASVYGNDAEIPHREHMAADRPLSPLAASKRAAELLCHTYHHLFGLTVHCLRLSAVFGPRERPDLPMHELALFIRDGRPLAIHGEESGLRDYTYVDDVVTGIGLSLDRARHRNGEASEYQVINLTAGEAREMREVCEKLSAALGVPLKGRSPWEPAESQPLPYCAIDKGAELLGYRPSVSLEEGIASFSRWFGKTGSGQGQAPAENRLLREEPR